MIPGLHDAVTPGQGRGFDLDQFLDRNGSVYLVASGDEDSPLTPLFRAFASWLHWSAGLAGTLKPAGRLPMPLLEALDELAVICPVDLPAMLADCAGKGILIVAVAHSRSQLAQRWGEHGAETIWALTGTKILLPGISDAKTLSDVSDLCGSVNLGEDEGKPVRIVPPELLRALPDWRALVVRMNLSPVVVKFRPAWKRRGYRRLSRRPAPLYVPQQLLDQAPPVLERRARHGTGGRHGDRAAAVAHQDRRQPVTAGQPEFDAAFAAFVLPARATPSERSRRPTQRPTRSRRQSRDARRGHRGSRAGRNGDPLPAPVRPADVRGGAAAEADMAAQWARAAAAVRGPDFAELEERRGDRAAALTSPIPGPVTTPAVLRRGASRNRNPNGDRVTDPDPRPPRRAARGPARRAGGVPPRLRPVGREAGDRGHRRHHDAPARGQAPAGAAGRRPRQAPARAGPRAVVVRRRGRGQAMLAELREWVEEFLRPNYPGYAARLPAAGPPMARPSGSSAPCGPSGSGSTPTRRTGTLGGLSAWHDKYFPGVLSRLAASIKCDQSGCRMARPRPA